jgi:hypothetical protein
VPILLFRWSVTQYLIQLLAPGATDMRKGFEGLYGLVRDRLQCEPLSAQWAYFLVL